MIVRSEIKKLEELGRMPDESDDSVSVEMLNLYKNSLHNVAKPVNYEEAKILVRLFPESGCYGGEWTLLHLFESIFPIEENKYVQLIAECPSKEWRERLTERFENWKNQKDE